MSDERESTEVSVSFPAGFVDDELLPLHPAATNAPQAVRMATQAHVKHEQQKVTPADIKNSVIAALEEYGGSVENIQRVVIGGAEAEVEGGDDVAVEDRSSG